MITNIQMYTHLEIVDTSQGDRTIIVPSPLGYCRMTVRCLYDFMGSAKASCSDLAGFVRLSQEYTIIFGPKMTVSRLVLSSRSPCSACTWIVRYHCDVSAGYWLTIFSDLSLCGVKQNRRGHDARKPLRWLQGLLQRRHGNGDLNIVWASYARRKAHVTEA